MNLPLQALQDKQAKAHASMAEKRSLHATQTRIERQRLLKIRLKDGAAVASKLLHAQAALVLREQQQMSDKYIHTAQGRELNPTMFRTSNAPTMRNLVYGLPFQHGATF